MRQRKNQLRNRRRLTTERLEDRRLLASGPYAPAAGQPSSTAIAMDDPAIVAWATDWSQYAVGSDVSETFQTPEKALGPAQGTSFDIVSLGRAGEITLQFEIPIRDGLGADFAIFENSVTDNFLELAYVEVSSNGVDFVRFDTDSLTASAVGPFGSIDPTNIDGVAGKYRQGFGTPFDLSELAGVNPALDVTAVTHVRLVDIVGDGAQKDSSGKPIYDPYPTVGSAGFDLDAIGVINQAPYVIASVGFEDVGQTLSTEASWSGHVPDGTPTTGPYGDQVVVGEFPSDDVYFRNAYSLDYGSWSGWAYSNQTNTTTEGYLNQFSAITGGGANGSATYGVSFASSSADDTSAVLTLPDDAGPLHSMQITNTTYAALSMRNGDSFAKKFGGDSGTDPDWFLLTIEGNDDLGASVGTVEFYLADFRSDDPAMDYIVDTWVDVDLSSLSGANSLRFSITSSDVGSYGVNTPTYFAMDELAWLTPSVAVDVLDHQIAEDAGAAATTGRVTRGHADVSSAVTVSLSSDIADLIVPPSVTIPAGESFVDFPIGVSNDSWVGGDRQALITATLATGTSDPLQATRAITILEDDVPTFHVVLDAESIAEGSAATATISRVGVDTSQALTVELSSVSPAIASVGPTVTIPAGASSATFAILAIEDEVDHGGLTVQFTATATGFETLSFSANVLDNDQPFISVVTNEDTFSESDAIPTTQFEDIGVRLADESFDNGADGGGGFVSNGLRLNNTYDPTFGSWSGWAISNTTDVVTPSYFNQYSAITGGGAHGSRTYAVSSGYAADPPSITRESDHGVGFQELSITNATYAALSMAQGDDYAKQFGGADGSDPDWFLLTIEGVNDQNESVGTVEFYLADYRFSDDSLDYIIEDWTTVDVSSLVGAVKLEFALSSSDVGDYGMNTPAYFAVDDIVIAESPTTSPDAKPFVTVTRQKMDLSEPLDVVLSSSDSHQLRLPAVVTIPAGQASVDVPLRIVDDIVVDGDAVVTITATADSLSANTSVTVQDNDQPTVTVSLGSSELDESLGNAQADFEDAGQRLTEDSHYSGQDGAGQFQSGDLVFDNHYNPTWGSWSGWALSNGTDQTTAGYGNQFSAFAGNGANASPTYAVGTGVTGNSAAAVRKTSDGLFDSLMVTNTTYAALSMAQGDAFAKRFGGESGDDPDYLLLTIEGFDAADQAIGSVEFYLADFRFADNALDYIVQDWTRVDLSDVAAAERLEFSVTSSDVGNYGVNTPAYFAVDDIRMNPSAALVGQGVVHRNDDDLSNAVTVTLQSDQPGRLLLPATVTIPAGSASVPFSFDVIDDSIASGNQVIAVAPTAEGYTPVAGIVNVLDNDESQLGLWLDRLVIGEGDGADAVTGVVSRNDADLDSALEVTLDVDAASGIVLPATITIPAGSRSVAFVGDVVSDGLVGEDQTVQVTANAAGGLVDTVALQVTEADVPSLAIEFSLASVSETDGVAAVNLTISRNPLDISEAIVVSLVGVADSSLRLPESITIDANQRSVTVALDLIDNVRSDGDREEVVTATGDGFADGVATIQITDNELAAIELMESDGVTRVSETGTSDTFTLRLTAQPEADVVISVSESDAGDYLVNATRFVFNAENWNVPQTVTLTGVADFNVEENESHTIQVAVVADESDPAFADAESVSIDLAIEEYAVENIELVLHDDELVIRDVDLDHTFSMVGTEAGLQWGGDDRVQRLVVDAATLGEQAVRLDLAGGDDVVSLTNVSLTNPGPLMIDGGDGWDRLTLTFSGDELDLAAFLANQISGFEEIVITTTEPTLLNLDANVIAQAYGQDVSMTLRVGMSEIMASSDWTLDAPAFVSGAFAQVLRFEHVEIMVVSDLPWRNARDRWDVNNSGSVSAADALAIINRLPLQIDARLPVIESIGDFVGMYYDVSGDGKVTPLDALNVINRLNRSVVTAPADLDAPAEPEAPAEPKAIPVLLSPVTVDAGEARQADPLEFVAVADTRGSVAVSEASPQRMSVVAGIDEVMREFESDNVDGFDSPWEMLDYQLPE